MIIRKSFRLRKFYSIKCIFLFILVVPLILSFACITYANNEYISTFKWLNENCSQIPETFIKTPTNIDKETLWELATIQENRGKKQQYFLSYADMYPEDSRAPEALFNVATDSVLKKNMYTDYNERKYLYGDREQILKFIIKNYEDTPNEILARFFLAADKLNTQEDNRRFSKSINTMQIKEAIEELKQILNFENVYITVLPYRTFWGVLLLQGDTHSATIYNIAYAYELLQDKKRAAKYYNTFLGKFNSDNNIIYLYKDYVTKARAHLYQLNIEDE